MRVVRRMFATWAFGAAASTCVAPARGAALQRDRQDQEDLARLRAEHPDTVDLLEQGEERVLRGDVVQAAALFNRAAEKAPDNALVARRECEAAAALGKRDQAVGACNRAGAIVFTTSTFSRTSPVQRRALVRAFMSRPEGLPSDTDVALAYPFAEEVRVKFPQEPWGYAALCDIAERTGDDVMLQHCLKDLERVAPNHVETQRAREAAAHLRPGWGVGAGWLLIAAASLGTLFHALRRGARRPRPALGALTVAAGLVLASRIALAVPSPDHPDRVSNWTIDDQDPEKSIPTPAMAQKDPLEMGYWLMDLTYKAQQAAKRGDHEAAVRYFSAMAKAVPNRSVAYSKLCREYLMIGDQVKAFPNCAAAVSLPGAKMDDYTQYVGLVLSTSGTLTDKRLASLNVVVERMRAMPKGTPGVDEIECAIGARTADKDLLSECVPGLTAKTPNEVLTFTAQWKLASLQGDVASARDVIARAKAAGMPQETIDQLEGQIERDGSRRTRTTLLGVALVVLLVIAGAALFVIVRGARKLPTDADLLRPAGADGAPPAGPPTQHELVPTAEGPLSNEPAKTDGEAPADVA